MLECADLNYYYGSSHRLKGVSFGAASGSLLGLFGHNGCGKSTLLKMLGGSLPVKSGNVMFFKGVAIGNDGYVLFRFRKNMGVLFQDTSSDEKLSAFDNLVYGARLMGLSRSSEDDLVKKTLRLANLSERAHDQVKKLSGGMRRRLELYRTFLHRPKIVLLDEPTAGLDVLETARFFSFLKDYQRETGATVLLSTHRPDELMHCDRVIMLVEGRMKADRTPLDMLKDLDYLRCSFAVNEGVASVKLDDLGLFDMVFDDVESTLRAKIRVSDLDTLLSSPMLRRGALKRFSMEKPNLADAYEELCSVRGDVQ